MAVIIAYNVSNYATDVTPRRTGVKGQKMEITEVKVFPVRNNGRLKAYASVVFDNSFIVRDMKVIEGHKGLFISMPSRRRKDGSFRDIAHPLNTDMRNAIEEKVISEYNNTKDEAGSDEAENTEDQQ